MRIQIIHNPTAGNGNHSKTEIINRITQREGTIDYISTEDEEWEKFLSKKPELIYVAGGDGTFHKLANILLENSSKASIPVRILPLGTANNISKTIKFFSDSCKEEVLKPSEFFKFSTGSIQGLKDEKYFFESVGFGLFPYHLKKMKNYSTNPMGKKSIQNTQELFYSHLEEFKARKAKIEVDGLTIKGKFLLIELMNVRFIGPNIPLTARGNPKDNFLELVLIPKPKKKILSQYLSALKNGKFSKKLLLESATILRTKMVKIKWKGKSLHVDDTLIPHYEGNKISLKLDNTLIVAC